MADSRNSGRYLAPALVACARRLGRQCRGTHHRSPVRCTGAGGAHHRGLEDFSRRLARDLSAGQSRTTRIVSIFGNTTFAMRQARVLVDSKVLAPAGREALG